MESASFLSDSQGGFHKIATSSRPERQQATRPRHRAAQPAAPPAD